MLALDMTLSGARSPRFALLACSVLEREIALYAEGANHIAETCFLEMGLHDQPSRLRTTLQSRLETLEARSDIEAVVLAYGLCGRGLVGLRPARHPLIIPRAHDCITLFLGSKEAYAEHQRRCPGCYYYTPGWNRNRRVPGPEKLAALRLEMASRFEPADVDFLVQTEREQWAAHNTATYVDLGTEDAVAEAAYARHCAVWLGWKFEHIHGDPALLRDLLWGNWDPARFQIIPPGCQVGHSPDDAILRADPVPAPSPAA